MKTNFCKMPDLAGVRSIAPRESLGLPAERCSALRQPATFATDSKNKFFTRILVSTLTGLLTVILTGCNTVPVTGRSQFNLMSTGQEQQLGLSSFDQLKKETPISKDPAANALVQKVGHRIAAVADKDMPGAQWEFVVFESKEANAFCLPGGKVGVYTGILPITRDEAGLATVIGHEVGHAVARHGGERMTDAMLLQTGGDILGASLSQGDPRIQSAALVAYGLTSQVGVTLPFSRAQESEADHIGLIYMARAGYDPHAAVAFWQRFADYNRQQGGNTPAFLRTHPTDATRVQQLETWMPEAMTQYHPAP
jgi:metalloendopeptidase OMA1, mitochondrial